MLENKIKKIKKEIIEFFKHPKEVISFFLPIIFVIVMLIPVPYYVKLGGGIIPLDKKITIDNQYNNKGELNALYVSEAKGNVLLYLLSYVVPSFEKVPNHKVVLDNENNKDYNYREKIYFENSTDVATKVAYDRAGKEIIESKNDYVVIYISKEAKTDLLVGDIVLKVNDKSVKSYSDIENTISSSNDYVYMLVLRNNKKINVKSKIIKMDDSPKIGIAISNVKSYKTNENIKFNFDKDGAGPSGGLMMALSIYNKITKKDITNGKKVMGTGTIALDGTVGPIGGVKHKLLGAYKNHADIVLVPYENYKEALKVRNEYGYKFKLIKVKSFDEALNKLNL